MDDVQGKGLEKQAGSHKASENWHWYNFSGGQFGKIFHNVKLGTCFVHFWKLFQRNNERST